MKNELIFHNVANLIRVNQWCNGFINISYSNFMHLFEFRKKKFMIMFYGAYRPNIKNAMGRLYGVYEPKPWFYSRHQAPKGNLAVVHKVRDPPREERGLIWGIYFQLSAILSSANSKVLRMAVYLYRLHSWGLMICADLDKINHDITLWKEIFSNHLNVTSRSGSTFRELRLKESCWKKSQGELGGIKTCNH